MSELADQTADRDDGLVGILPAEVGGPPALGFDADASRDRRDAIMTTIVGMVVFGLSAITGPLLARALDTAGRGDYQAIILPPTTIGYLLLFGFPVASVYYSNRHSHRSLMMSAWAWAFVAGGVVAIVAWPLVPRYLHNHDPRTIAWFRALLVAMIVFIPVSTAVELLRTRRTLVAFNVYRSFPLVLNTVVTIVLFAIGRLTLDTVAAAFFGVYLLWFVVVLTVTNSWPGRGFERDAFRVQFQYGARTALGSVSSVLISRLDQFLLVGVVSPSDLGLYAVAATAAGASGPAAVGIGLVLFRQVHGEADSATGAQQLRRSLRVTALVSSFVAALVAIASPIVLPLLFGEAFRDAVWPLLVLLPGQVFADLSTVVIQKLFADGRPATVSRAMILSLVITVVGLAATVGAFGIMAAAFVTSGSYLVLFLYVYVADRLGPRHPLRTPALDAVEP